MKKVRFGAHWLAFLWDLNQGDWGKMKPVVDAAKANGAEVFEVMPALLNKMSPKETAQALKDAGVNDAVMCHFYPPESGTGDPLGEDAEYDLALETFRGVIKNIIELRKNEINIDLIVGPSCFVLGKDYETSDSNLRSRVCRFYGDLRKELAAAKIRVAVELLRDEEDKVIKTVSNFQSLVVNLPADIFGFHFDTFHFRERGYNITEAIKRLGKRIFHFHANGKGRMPPGHELDDIKWDGDDGVVAALKAIEYDGIATNEPFCELVRKKAPELRVGLPDPMPEPEGLKMTFDNLNALGLFD